MSYYDEPSGYQAKSLTGSGTGFFAEMLHKRIENDFDCGDHFSKVLEVGSDQGQHLRYVQHKFDTYVMLDLREPKTIGLLPNNIDFIQGDVCEMPFPSSSFDRVVVTCVLHHLTDVKSAIQEIIRVSRVGGTINILLPIEPSIRYSMFRASLLLLKHKRINIVVKLQSIHKFHHIGSYNQIRREIESQEDIRLIKERYLPCSFLKLLNILTLRRVS